MNSPILQIDQRRKRRAMLVCSILFIILLIAFVLSMNTGVIRLAPLDVLRTLFGNGTPKQQLILFDFRLPRILISVLVGMGLAVSGCILQGVTRNALAEPGVLGINAGAGLMVVLYVSFFPMNQTSTVYLMPILAFLGAALTAALIYLLAYKKNQGLSPTRFILVGIAVAAGISAAMIVLTLRLNPNNYLFVATWLAGSIGSADWNFVLAVLPWLLVLLPYLFYKAKVLNVLSLDEMMAKGLGASVERERLKLLAAAVALAGACVAVGGGIGFIGLIGPHLARRLVGAKHQYLLPTSALCGGVLLIVADTLSRWILQPSELPTGIIVAVIGAPYFLYLMAKSKT